MKYNHGPKKMNLEDIRDLDNKITAESLGGPLLVSVICEGQYFKNALRDIASYKDNNQRNILHIAAQHKFSSLYFYFQRNEALATAQDND